MEELLIRNTQCLIQVEYEPVLKVCGRNMSELKTISNAFLRIKEGLIDSFGTMDELQKDISSMNDKNLKIIDASGRFVFPSFCDPHTHLVYSGSREIEYSDRIRGLSYAEIAKRGGGILNSARKLHDTSEDDLFEQSMQRIMEITALGTGSLEIKSGYGLNTADELKMLRVIKRIKD